MPYPIPGFDIPQNPSGQSGTGSGSSYWGESYWGEADWGDAYWATAAAAEPVPAECGSDLMARGMSWLTGQLQTHMSQPVVYKRGAAAVAVCATIGRTLFKLDDGDGGVRMEWSDRDFLIPTASLVLANVVVLPARGDLIRERKAGVLYTYEVLAPGGEPPWRYSDPHRNMLRVHTKLVESGPA